MSAQREGRAMCAAFRDVEAGLRSSRAETALVAAVTPVREWSSDMASAAALLPESDAMPAAPEVRSLIDPLADSALATVGTDAQAAKRQQSECRATPARRWSPASGHPARSWIAARFSTDEQRVRPSATSGPGAVGKPMQSASRLASLLARHDHVRAGLGDSGFARMQWEAECPSDRKVVLLPSRRPTGDVVRPGERMQASQGTASTISRWNALVLCRAADRGEAAEDFDVAEEMSRRPWLLRDELYGLPPAPLDAGTLPEDTSTALEPLRPEETLRLGELTDPQESTPPERAAQPEPPTVAAAQHGSLGRVFDSLARIEQQIATRSQHAEPATEWYDDDDGLAARIHGILRRQVERHGIDLP